VAGDLLHRAFSSPYLEAWIISTLRGYNPLAIPGQHDLPNHNLKLYHKSSMTVLENSGALLVGKGEAFDTLAGEVHTFAYGQAISRVKRANRPLKQENRSICLAHQLVYRGRELWPGMEAERARDLLDRVDYDLVVTGDNHQTFTLKRDGKLLVNPGSLMRQDADQEDHQPCVFLYYAETNEAEPVYLPIEDDVISRDHLDRQEARENRINVFVARLQDDYEVGLSYRKNLRVHMRKNKTVKQVKDLVWQAVGEE
jgi:DNA repair exonuclease SbcCD nuclease subunit